MKDYWRMSNNDLELEAHKHNIGEYGFAEGASPISRGIIISQLVARDAALISARSDRRAWIALVLSVVSIAVNVVQIVLR